MSPQATTMRIGELSRHVGVSTHVLRAWESRYGLLRPIRSPGGYRLYGPGDARRVLAVLALREEGVSAAEACRTVLRQERRPAPDTLSMRLPRILPDGTVAPDEGGSHVNGDGPNRLAEDLAEVMDCLQDFDESGAQMVLDRLLDTLSFEEFVADALMPTLQDVGRRWAAGELSVAHEHFASQLIRQRLASYSLAWSSGTGPVAVLACPPGEQHDLAAHCLGILLARRGWRVRFLGADTPMDDLLSACRTIRPDLVIVSALAEAPLRAVAGPLRALAQDYPLALGGRGATTAVVELTGARALPGDLVAAADGAVATARHTASAATSASPAGTTSHSEGTDPR